MKQAINQYLPVEFGGVSLDDVAKIEFLFRQQSAARTVLYPSDEAVRLENSSVIQVMWTPEQTAQFSSAYEVELDTRITLNGTAVNPETPIVRFKINRSLFKAGEDT